MQFTVYDNTYPASAYPYLLDVQSDLIDVLSTRLMIPLYALDNVRVKISARLCPEIEVNGEKFLVMTHEMAAVRISQIGKAVGNANEHRNQIKAAIDFLIDGF
ncbi:MULTISPECIES: CcdB family protein [Serratia]|uniref:CcdB family protein n=1 Tax=Serratia TaxID=613 RepID=UPI000F7DFFBA|nr:MULTISPECIES: CcdB family protein [Serratia]MBF8217901.1 CcdB family protein [Serratia ureilytica]MBF8243006.1 CcdB family protein [Serratia ureilytica]MBH3265802.1 CcdB family protein [Serratia ureilytica]NCJ10011.1 cytotoxin [Serratia marcescens]NDJ02929.1 cytotoxin [Serratia marcescens]